MLKKTFIRILLLGTMVFATFFVLISANKPQAAVNSDCTETEIKKEEIHPQGEFIWESFAGTILIGLN